MQPSNNNAMGKNALKEDNKTKIKIHYKRTFKLYNNNNEPTKKTSKPFDIVPSKKKKKNKF